MKSNLIAGKKYCATYYVNISNNSTYGIDAFGIYFGDNTLDTITYCTIPITYLVPQIQNPTNNIIVDTLGWVAVTGTFVASGSEKYLVLGNFKADSAVNKSLTNPANLPGVATDLCIDDVTCVELNLPAYAGPDKSCIPGDSVFIGRQSDWAIDPGCIWYKLPNPIPIDTISGLWVKPSFTSTYVVRQVLDCSPLKWDTVVVFIDAVGLTDLQNYSDNIKLFPNPTETDLTVTFGIGSDINKIAIINSLGQTIREEDLRIRKTEFTVSTSELEKGIYLIQFRTSVGTLTKLFIKN